MEYLLPNDIFGQWTKKGRLFYLKWSNFKKFLKDNSLINEHPPESIVVWKKYLIYGAALGVADNVYKSMKLQEKNIPAYDDDIFLYCTKESTRFIVLVLECKRWVGIISESIKGQH